MKRLIYICSPCRGDYERNITKAQEYCREAIEAFPDVLPLAPHVYFTQFLNDTIPHEREVGMKLGIELLDLCDELWVYGAHISKGMVEEIEYADDNGIPVKSAAEVFAAKNEKPAELGAVKLSLPPTVGSINGVAAQEGHEIHISGEVILELAKMLRRNKGADFELSPNGGEANGMG